MSSVTFAFLLLFSAVYAQILGPYYHDDVGIPTAEAIWKSEMNRQVWRGDQNSRIIGGLPSVMGEHPYFAGLLITLSDGKSSVCGASLVTNTRVVTAAHCWRDGRHQATEFTVVLGSTTLFFGGTRVFTSNVTTHEDYNYTNLWNDIAIAVIPHVSSSNTIWPIALPPSSFNSTLVGRRAQITGFGKTSDSNDIVHMTMTKASRTQSITLQPSLCSFEGWKVDIKVYVAATGITLQQSLRDVYVRLISSATCAEVYGPVVYEGSLCSWGPGWRGPCGGDSGGPLTVHMDGWPVLVGVVSFGSSRGCQAGYPSGFTRISYFLPWIQERL